MYREARRRVDIQTTEFHFLGHRLCSVVLARLLTASCKHISKGNDKDIQAHDSGQCQESGVRLEKCTDTLNDILLNVRWAS